MAVVYAMENQITVHGGGVFEASRRLGVHPDKILDFSSSINPLGTPKRILESIRNSLEQSFLRTYPDEHELISALARNHSVSSNEIVVANGSAALIFAVLRAVFPQRVLLLEPAFSEYSRACSAIGAAVTRYQLNDNTGFRPNFGKLAGWIEERRFDLILLNSPHNPTGYLYPKDELLDLLEIAKAREVAILLDEAFIDYVPDAGLAPVAPRYSRLFVLRSLTKFYAMPGLRVGYGVCRAGLAEGVKKQIEAWPISTAALEAARTALDEEEFALKSRKVNSEAREEFADALRSLALFVFESSANFLLIRLPECRGAELALWLEGERILIRRCDSFQGLGDEYIRLAVRSREDNLKLVSLLGTWLKTTKSGA